ncbi:MAG: hypothetical protein ACFBSD_03700 [Paracoccaceae bacterium]
MRNPTLPAARRLGFGLAVAFVALPGLSLAQAFDPLSVDIGPIPGETATETRLAQVEKPRAQRPVEAEANARQTEDLSDGARTATGLGAGAGSGDRADAGSGEAGGPSPERVRRPQVFWDGGSRYVPLACTPGAVPAEINGETHCCTTLSDGSRNCLPAPVSGDPTESRLRAAERALDDSARFPAPGQPLWYFDRATDTYWFYADGAYHLYSGDYWRNYSWDPAYGYYRWIDPSGRIHTGYAVPGPYTWTDAYGRVWYRYYSNGRYYDRPAYYYRAPRYYYSVPPRTYTYPDRGTVDDGNSGARAPWWVD